MKLCWIKPKRSIRVLQQHFEDKSKVLFKASNHQRIPGDTNFLQDKLCKQGSSRSLSLQARKLSQRVLKPPSSTLEVYKERSFVGSSLNAPIEFFNNTLKTNQRYSAKHQITRGFREIQISFKTSSASKEALALSLQARKLSQRVLKPPSSTLEVYKERSSVGSSLNAP
jgi:hypothetical protein